MPPATNKIISKRIISYDATSLIMPKNNYELLKLFYGCGWEDCVV
jgi:hypothetical protein